jgi:predicted double-glycine peptidase
MKNAHCRTWNMTRKLKNVENETQTLFDMEYGGKNLKLWKFRNAHYRT